MYIFVDATLWTCQFVLEICSVANGATKKEIGRAKEYIVKQLEVELGQSMEMGTIHAGDFLVSSILAFWNLSCSIIFSYLDSNKHRLVQFWHFQRRFCSHLGMNNQAVKAAQEAVQKSEELDIR